MTIEDEALQKIHTALSDETARLRKLGNRATRERAYLMGKVHGLGQARMILERLRPVRLVGSSG